MVGQRVVVRRVLPGQSGPTGGPAFTDTLGECLSWGRGLCEVRTEDGTVVTIHVADIVSGKPVPPRASVRLRVPASELHRRSTVMFPDVKVVTDPALGDWTLRAGGTSLAGRAARRGNSLLALGAPGVPVPEAAARAVVLLQARSLTPVALVVSGSDEEADLKALAWTPLGGDAEAQVAATSRVQRSLPAPPALAELEELSPTLAEARLGQRARVRVGLDESRGEVWACIADLWVSPEERRTGLARGVLAEAVDWAAAHGASTLHLQVESSNPAALALYGSLGFVTHHRYRYLTLG